MEDPLILRMADNSLITAPAAGSSRVGPLICRTTIDHIISHD